MVTGSATATDLTQRSLRWFWRVGPSDRTYADTYFAWLRATGRAVSRVVLVHGADQASRDGAALLHRAAPSDIEVTEDMQLPADAADLTSEVLRLEGYHPDAVFVLAGFEAVTLLVRTMARLGYTPPALLGLGGGLGDPRLAPTLGPLADYSVTRTAWSPEIGARKPLAAAVIAAFRREFGQDMTEDSARDFEAMLTLGMAIQAADSTDPVRLRAALAQTDRTSTITSWRGIRFDAAGQNVLASGVIEQMTTGAYHVVYPAEVAAARLVWPMPPLNRR
jgi:branched-chain amino acid transport system substrate-binding protein